MKLLSNSIVDATVCARNGGQSLLIVRRSWLFPLLASSSAAAFLSPLLLSTLSSGQ